MNKFLTDNWFKLGVLLAISIASLSASYYFVVVLPGKLNQNFSYRKIQDSEVLAVIPAGYRLAQVEDGKNDVNYITAHLEDSKDDLVVVLLEWSRPQLPLPPGFGTPPGHHPVMVKVLKFSHESDKWQEYTRTTLFDHTNIRFSYKLINLDGDKTDKLVLFPFFYALDDLVYNAAGEPVGIKPDATMAQSAAILKLKDGELVDMIRYGFGGPHMDNVTAAGGRDSMWVGADGSLIFGDFVKPLGASWKGCYPLRYQRYFFKKDAAELLVHAGAFVLFDEFITRGKYTGDAGHKECRFLIVAVSAWSDEGKAGSIPTSFLQIPSDPNIVGVKEKF